MKKLVILIIAGIIALYFLSWIDPKTTIISQIKNEGEVVTVYANVKYVQDYGLFKIIKISDLSGNINILTQGISYFKKDTRIKVIGKVVSYNGTLEIQAGRVTVI